MLNIVVIGDSIAKGVGSSDAKTKSFGALIGDKVEGTVTNLGITGLDSGQLINKLKTEKFQKAVEDADVIFISIGSNDLLKPFLGIVADAAGASGEDKDLYKNLQTQFAKLSKNDPLAAGDALANAVKRIKVSPELKQGVEQFPDNFRTIIQQLKTQNPDAVIYVNNIYNPYYGVAYEYKGLTLLNIHDLCEGYIQDMNGAFDRTAEDYTVIDMYSIFRQTGYTNVNGASLEDMSGLNFDPHPNDAGYQMMADYIYTHMDSIAPKAEVLWEMDASAVPVTQEAVQILFSEKVRAVSGKKLYLNTETECVSYTLNGGETVENLSDGSWLLTLPLSGFLGDNELEYGMEYELIMEDGAFKDKGNNSPKEQSLAVFQTEADPESGLEVNSATVLNPDRQNAKNCPSAIIWGSVVTFVVIAVAIAGMMMYNKKHVKNRDKGNGKD